MGIGARGKAMRPAQRKTKKAEQPPEPTWEIAHLFPAQGTWSEDEYLDLDTNRLVEFSDGFLEFLPMPTMSHQMLLAYLFKVLSEFATSAALGLALFAGIRVRLWRRKFRQPDIVFMLKQHADRMGEEFWNRADLVMEIVSGGKEDRRRDLKTKRAEYARARIPEYWIVDPEKERITVLRLSGKRYVVHGEFAKGDTATSHLLSGFTVDVAEAFAKAARPAASKTPGATGRKRKE
jgi:Uma2 family endonuclease